MIRIQQSVMNDHYQCPYSRAVFIARIGSSFKIPQYHDCLGVKQHLSGIVDHWRGDPLLCRPFLFVLFIMHPKDFVIGSDYPYLHIVQPNWFQIVLSVYKATPFLQRLFLRLCYSRQSHYLFILDDTIIIIEWKSSTALYSMRLLVSPPLEADHNPVCHL